ncbi:hypothetical protein [Salmonirosea aquatica]|uniref:Uncharacterized protein n=1 Tax=Salmonirosea aquatica TaxID=2654236 RepID=A0A7C9BJ85_9BACT|nr:hypothetical protein [Cytophagaceae bacterium SJW1-29]
MKTNRFDEILRRKLESIQPDFQDQDWDAWQAFRQHATPTFWQTYGHWLGYAVATVTTAVMVVLYVNQSNQNQDLLKEMQALKQQLTTTDKSSQVRSDSAASGGVSRGEVPLSSPLPDTVYVVECRTVYIERPPGIESTENVEDARPVADPELRKTPDVSEKTGIAKNQRKQADNPTPGAPLPATEEAIVHTNPRVSEQDYKTDPKPGAALPTPNGIRQSEDLTKPIGKVPSKGTLPVGTGLDSEAKPSLTAVKNYDSERLDLGEIVALPTPVYTKPATNVYRRLQGRMPQPARTAAPEQRLAQVEKPAQTNQKTEVPISIQKVEKVAKDERLLPDFGLGLPYRVGAGQLWEGRTKALGVWNEVLLGKHWSVQGGLTFQKLEDQKFYNDRIFREKTHEDFRKEHAKPFPQSFEIFNITIETTLFQIPLNLNYRGELGHNFAYFAGVGTTLNLRARQELSFDFRLPTNDFGEQSAERTVPFPLINNVNLQAGVEKRWSPIVLQASLLLDNRFKPLPGLDDRTGLGLQMKLLYELGTAKKK